MCCDGQDHRSAVFRVFVAQHLAFSISGTEIVDGKLLVGKRIGRSRPDIRHRSLLGRNLKDVCHHYSNLNRSIIDLKGDGSIGKKILFTEFRAPVLIQSTTAICNNHKLVQVLIHNRDFLFHGFPSPFPIHSQQNLRFEPVNTTTIEGRIPPAGSFVPF